mmetsp:Transcript_33695/g.78746  ORF Transcript_33695/g.78746 Transcript_33695/m.78746 type:complete len:232 (-) Transcript_33695:635-1330(-)
MQLQHQRPTQELKQSLILRHCQPPPLQRGCGTTWHRRSGGSGPCPPQLEQQLAQRTRSLRSEAARLSPGVRARKTSGWRGKKTRLWQSWRTMELLPPPAGTATIARVGTEISSRRPSRLSCLWSLWHRFPPWRTTFGRSMGPRGVEPERLAAAARKLQQRRRAAAPHKPEQRQQAPQLRVLQAQTLVRQHQAAALPNSPPQPQHHRQQQHQLGPTPRALRALARHPHLSLR